MVQRRAERGARQTHQHDEAEHVGRKRLEESRATDHARRDGAVTARLRDARPPRQSRGAANVDRRDGASLRARDQRCATGDDQDQRGDRRDLPPQRAT